MFIAKGVWFAFYRFKYERKSTFGADIYYCTWRDMPDLTSLQRFHYPIEWHFSLSGGLVDRNLYNTCNTCDARLSRRGRRSGLRVKLKELASRNEIEAIITLQRFQKKFAYPATFLRHQP